MSQATTALVANHSPPAPTPLYDMRLNPPYFVDYTSTCSGKHIAVAKRRVCFRFGFSKADALARGATGIDCRGSEHEVTLEWSLTSGKRLLLVDESEVHFSIGKPTQGKFQFSWTMRGNHVLKMIAHAAPSLKAKPGWRQFDLQLDGLSVFDMPRIYELGIAADGDASVMPYKAFQQQTYNYHELPSEDEMAWAHRVEEHEARRHMNRSLSKVSSVPSHCSDQSAELKRNASGVQNQEVKQSVPLLSHVISDPTPVSEVQDCFGVPVAMLDQAPSAPVERVYQQETVGSMPQASTAPFFEDVTGNMMSCYATSPAASMPALPSGFSNEMSSPTANSQHTCCEPQFSNVPQFSIQASIAKYAPADKHASDIPVAINPINAAQFTPPLAQLSQAWCENPFPPEQNSQVVPPSTIDARPTASSACVRSATADTSAFTFRPEDVETGRTTPPVEYPENHNQAIGVVSPRAVIDVLQAERTDDLGKALKNLVNLSDINDGPNDPLESAMENLATNSFAERNVPDQKRKRNAAVRSKGLPPTSSGWAMSGRSLSEVKAAMRNEGQRSPKREILKTWNSSAQAGMMVVYGSPAPCQTQGCCVSASQPAPQQHCCY